MDTVQEIEERIEQLKWSSLPPFKRITSKKEQVFKGKFGSKERQKELKWQLLSYNVLILMLSVSVIVSVLWVEVNDELLLFLLFAIALVLGQKLEMKQRLNNLNEAKFLKRLLKQIKDDNQ